MIIVQLLSDPLPPLFMGRSGHLAKVRKSGKVLQVINACWKPRLFLFDMNSQYKSILYSKGNAKENAKCSKKIRINVNPEG